jgi:hypothetical protein
VRRRPLNLARLKSPWVIVPVLLVVFLGCLLAVVSSYVQEVSWKGALRGYLPPDARDVRFGGSTDLLTVEGVAAFRSSPAQLDKLVASGGFSDVTVELGLPDGRYMRADLDELGRRHLGQSLDSLGTIGVYQKILREVSDVFEDVVLVRAEAHGKAILYYRYQQ